MGYSVVVSRLTGHNLLWIEANVLPIVYYVAGEILGVWTRAGFLQGARKEFIVEFYSGLLEKNEGLVARHLKKEVAERLSQNLNLFFTRQQPQLNGINARILDDASAGPKFLDSNIGSFRVGDGARVIDNIQILRARSFGNNGAGWLEQMKFYCGLNGQVTRVMKLGHVVVSFADGAVFIFDPATLLPAPYVDQELKIGDKVQISTNIPRSIGLMSARKNLGWKPEFERFAGKIGTITAIRNKDYIVHFLSSSVVIANNGNNNNNTSGAGGGAALFGNTTTATTTDTAAAVAQGGGIIYSPLLLTKINSTTTTPTRPNNPSTPTTPTRPPSHSRHPHLQQSRSTTAVTDDLNKAAISLGLSEDRVLLSRQRIGPILERKMSSSSSLQNRLRSASVSSETAAATATANNDTTAVEDEEEIQIDDNNLILSCPEKEEIILSPREDRLSRELYQISRKFNAGKSSVDLLNFNYFQVSYEGQTGLYAVPITIPNEYPKKIPSIGIKSKNEHNDRLTKSDGCVVSAPSKQDCTTSFDPQNGIRIAVPFLWKEDSMTLDVLVEVAYKWIVAFESHGTNGFPPSIHDTLNIFNGRSGSPASL